MCFCCAAPTCKSPGLPEKYLDASRPTFAARTTPYRLLPGPVRYLRRATPAQVRATYHMLPLCVPKAAAAKRRARHADGSADDAVAMCSASRSWRCLACTSAIPISSSQRSSATSWLLPTRPYARSTSRADRSKRTSIHRLLCVCLSLRLFVRTVCLEDCAQEAATRIGRGGC